MKNHAQICQKSHKNHLKLTPGGSWGRSCGHCSPQVPPGQQKRRKNVKIGASTGYPEGPENRYFRVKTETKPDGKGSMIHCPFSWYLPWAFRLDFDSFLTALGIIKIVKSVQLYAYLGVWPLEDGDAFRTSFLWPKAAKMETKWQPKETRMASNGSNMVSKRVFEKGMKKRSEKGP